MKQSRREYYSNEIYKELNKTPESISNFICCVVDECSMWQVERIFSYYKNSLPQIYKATKNLDN